MKRLLIVEDQDEIREMNVRVLERFFLVVAVASGEAALEVLGSGNRFDRISTDVDMPPGISGIEFLRIARANDLLGEAEIVVTTGNPDEQVEQACQEFSAKLIKKPYSLNMELLPALGWE